MRWKAVYLPYFVSRVFQVFCFVMVFLLDIINFLLIPITWVQFKSHTTAFVGFLIAGGYWYIAGVENAVKKASVGFVALVLIIAVIKLTKKILNQYRQRLARYIYGFPPCLYLYKNPTQSI